MFRWDLFLRDYRSYLDKQTDSRKVLGGKWNVHQQTLSGLHTGRLTYVGRTVLDRILKGMNLYYEFYCE